MARSNQTSFASGEVDPGLYGRVDLATYVNGLALCENGYVRVFGGVRKRPGTRFVGAIPDKGRLLRFELSTIDNYVLVFTSGEMRIIRNGGFVLVPGTNQVAVIAHSYTALQLPDLKYNQSGNAMTLVHPEHPVIELTRQDHHLWTFTSISFLPALAAPAAPSVAATRTYDQEAGAGSETLTHKYRVTAVRDSDGDESLPSAIGQVTALGKLGSVQFQITSPPEQVTQTNFNTITWSAVTGADRYNVYKERNGLYGFVGSTEELTFRDDDINPDLTIKPPANRDLFSASGDRPGAVGRYEQRLFLGGSDAAEETYHASQTGRFRNFGRRDPLQDDDAITATLTGDRVNRIFHFVTVSRRLLILTRSAEWVLNRSEQRGLTPSLEGGQAEESYHGSSQVRPLRINNNVLWVEDGGEALIEGAVDVVNGLTTAEASLLSEHLFRGRPIVDICYARQPYRLVWCVLDDGTLASLSYLREQQVLGWARHTTDGFWQSCASVREGTRDVTYLIALRGTQWTVERMDTVDEDDPRASFYVDSGLSLDVPIPIDVVDVFGGILGNGIVLTITDHGLVVGDSIDIAELEAVVAFGADGERSPSVAETLNGKRFRVVAVNGDLVSIGPEFEPEDGSLDFIDGTGLVGATGGVVRKAVTNLTGLEHLEGRRVRVLADGGDAGFQVVEDGTVTLSRLASQVHAGLDFSMQMQTLSIAGDPEAVGRTKLVDELKLTLRKTRGLKAGPNAENLAEIRSRSVEDWGEPTRLRSDQFVTSIPGTYTEEGQVLLVHDSPLPCEVLGIVPNFRVGGG